MEKSSPLTIRHEPSAISHQPCREALSPCRADRLADQEGRIGAGARSILLHPAVVDLGDVEVAVGVDAYAVHAPHAAGVWTPDSPGIHEVAVEIVLEDLVRTAISGPQRAVAHDVEQMDIRRLVAESPLGQKLPILVEHLRAVVAAIVDEHPPRLRIDRNAVDVVEVTGPRVVRRIAFLAPGHHILAVLVELDHPRPVVTVRHDEAAVGEPVDERGAVEMLVVRAGLAVCADRLYFRFAVMRELVNHVLVIVDDPDVLFRIVGADGDEVRPLQLRIPLVPRLDEVARTIEHHDAVLPAGVDTHRVARSLPGLDSPLSRLPGPAVAGRT